MHSSERENSDPAHFNHHHVRWLRLLVIGSRRLICSSRIPQRFRQAVCRARAVERRPDRAVSESSALISHNKIIFFRLIGNMKVVLVDEAPS